MVTNTKEYYRRWEKNNPDKVKAKRKRYIEKHKERLYAYNRKLQKKQSVERKIKKAKQECSICGFNRYLESCHMVPKCKGGKECMWLCPNHHKLYDNQLLYQGEKEMLEEKLLKIKV